MGFPGSSVFKLLVVAVALTAAHAAARHKPNEQERTINLNQYINNMKTKVNQDVAAMINNQNQARTLLERQQTEMQNAQQQMKEMFSEAERSLNSAVKDIRNKFEQFLRQVVTAES